MEKCTVTIDKAYFETLLRRAEFHTSGADISVATVTIDKAEYENLLATACQYENLRVNLYRGGITDDTLEILTQDDAALNYGSFAFMENGAEVEPSSAHIQQSVHAENRAGPGAQHVKFQRNNDYGPRYSHQAGNNTSQSHSPVDERVCTPDEAFDDPRDGGPSNRTKPTRQRYEKFAKRTIYLVNLSPVTCHADVVDAVRGGMLLDVYLRLERFNGKTASISFLEEAQALEFFQHVKCNDLFIRGKKVEIRWSDRQFILPSFVANKISIGATRNLVIHDRDPNETERSIRDDLHHIHNLVVIKVTFKGSDAYISTNSVHNALFARTCMMSRGKYKTSKIEWYPDECAAPFEARQQVSSCDVVQKKKAAATPMNRFQILDMDGIDDDSQGGKDLNGKPDMFENSLASSFERLD